MLYPRKGDGGTTETFSIINGCDQRLSKSSVIAEAFGAVDELNSLLGFVKTQCSTEKGEALLWQGLALTLTEVQQNLFIIQAELGGASGQAITTGKVVALEKIIDEIEKKLPPIKTFLIAGGIALAALLDFARAVARRAERRVIKAREEKLITLSDATMAYLNRLSSLLYALARLVNHKSGITEQAPTYK